ncbi:uncharacterized protein LOC111358396 [Spodoptera litura]|uniref:Malate dehydrogenase, mitochondrial n=1 Tax=Spodoptera litura TaxID=69820 RepID=A0A9J7EF37_SPOLT|nr:uncharacterized protein LOC111358396 [Spodoptera litura]
MFTRKLLNQYIFLCNNIKCIQIRNIQASVIGAAGEVGSNLSLLLKQNNKLLRLQLYDDDEKIMGTAMELSLLPGGPEVTAFVGNNNLHAAVRGSDLIVMVHRVPRKPGNTREQMLAANAPALHKLCRAMSDENPTAFFAIATIPLNSLVPFASALLYKYGTYNPFKVFGVTHIDTARARTYAANALNVSSRNLFLPVIGGHSDDTVIPLFSNITPVDYSIDPCQADSLTRLLRKAGTEIVFQKQGSEAAVLGVARSINEFCDLIFDAVCGSEVIVNSYTANPNFGTRFFSGPTTVGPYGIISRPCQEFTFNDYESFLLGASVPVINNDVSIGERYVQYVESMGKAKY